MERCDVGEDKATALLNHATKARHRRLHVVAQNVVDEVTRGPDEVPPVPDPPIGGSAPRPLSGVAPHRHDPASSPPPSSLHGPQPWRQHRSLWGLSSVRTPRQGEAEAQSPAVKYGAQPSATAPGFRLGASKSKKRPLSAPVRSGHRWKARRGDSRPSSRGDSGCLAYDLPPRESG